MQTRPCKRGMAQHSLDGYVIHRIAHDTDYSCIYINNGKLKCKGHIQKGGGGKTFMENTEQDGRLIHLLTKKLNMFLGVHSVLDMQYRPTHKILITNNSYKFWGVLIQIRIWKILKVKKRSLFLALVSLWSLFSARTMEC